MSAPELPRRPTLGLQCLAADDPRPGLRVLAARPPAAGLVHPGDLLLALDDLPVATPAALAAAIHDRRPGDRLTLHILRDDHLLTIPVTLAERPRETWPGAQVLYDMVQVPGARLRTILTLPDVPGPRPAWLLLPGVTCVSVDLAIHPAHPLRPPIAALTAAGAITLRVERPGLGDSEGPPADLLSFHAELAACAAGLAALAAHPRVDARALGVFGHSLGGMIAPLLAATRSLARIAVAGTTALAWDRCIDRAVAREAARTGRPYAALRPHARTARSPQFDRELAAVDLPAAWSRVTADVLVARGLADDVVDAADSDALVALLERRPRGSVRRLDLPGAAHDDLSHPALLAALAAW